MTYAICPKCGESKVGALIPCSNCQFRPTNDQDVSYAIILTDHYLVASDLKEIGRRIKYKQRFELGYFFLPMWKRILWRILKYLGLIRIAKGLLANIEVKTLNSRR